MAKKKWGTLFTGMMVIPAIIMTPVWLAQGVFEIGRKKGRSTRRKIKSSPKNRHSLRKRQAGGKGKKTLKVDQTTKVSGQMNAGDMSVSVVQKPKAGAGWSPFRRQGKSWISGESQCFEHPSFRFGDCVRRWGFLGCRVVVGFAEGEDDECS